VIISFAFEITNRVFFRKSLSVGRASGSVSIARRIWRSVRARTRFQLLPSLADDIPLRFSFISLYPRGRDDSTLVAGHIRAGRIGGGVEERWRTAQTRFGARETDPPLLSRTDPETYFPVWGYALRRRAASDVARSRRSSSLIRLTTLSQSSFTVSG